ncbi:hypothetical protein PA598K_07147 [Paenibacillus sp. 598K]|uniref:DUF6809 family protein n=1 Tax=Paenibacillus sp. 598K TaxID=1117987 RepID=UPI000FF96225|nr:DUF6809 family protein [Paenibacillus sp. 598K]GBF78496.1 hypothetical protein PA598K_07147 [Paenibacillus sp. 598K]
MKTLLSALYHGELHPDESIIPTHPDYRSLSRQAAAYAKLLRERLGEEVFRELEPYFDLCESRDSMQVEAAFLHEFKLGANILIEVMNNRDDFPSTAASGKSS